MPRRQRISRRVLLPDARFNNRVVAKFINSLMRGGKKALAERIMYTALESVEGRTRRPGLEVFEQAMRNATPIIEVKPRRVGGATYQVPVEIRGDRRQALAIRWLINAARARSGRSMVEKLAAELLDAANNTGATIRRREEAHRMAEANKAYSHYSRF
jgi:small subunit ribosomal protein S7